jgi:crossover junction endodeoxyribonuclease RuvC
MNVAGIDVGLGGAVAIVNAERVVFVADMPVHTLVTGKARKVALDLASLREILMQHPIDHAVIERVAARPGQGVSSMFKFGFCAGAVTGVLAGLKMPYSLILPIAWQRIAGCGPSPDAARQRAAQLYPDAAGELRRKRDGGRADAILIAHAGRRMLQAATP